MSLELLWVCKLSSTWNLILNLNRLNYQNQSFHFIGNSLGGAYGESDSYERRRKARSNDFLDRIDISVLSTRSSANTTTSKRKPTPKMNRIERGLFLGSLEAATDVILLESNAITHIVTVDSVPLPRKITSMMPRIAMLHLQVWCSAYPSERYMALQLCMGTSINHVDS